MPTAEKNLEKLESLITLLQEGVSKEEFVKSFEAVIDLVLKIEKNLRDKNQEYTDLLTQLYQELGIKIIQTNTQEFSAVKSKIEQALIEQQNGMNFIYDKVRKIKEGKDGYTPRKGFDYFDGYTPIKGVDYFDGLAGSPDTPVAVREKLESLNENERLDKDAIKGLNEVLQELRNQTSRRLGGRGVAFSKTAMDFHIIDGETPTGTINDINRVFTLADRPTPSGSLKLFLNGVRQREGSGNDFTLSGLTITFTNAPGTGSILLCDYRV